MSMLVIHGKCTQVELVIQTTKPRKDDSPPTDVDEYKSRLTFPDPLDDQQSLFRSYWTVTVNGKLQLGQDVLLQLTWEDFEP